MGIVTIDFNFFEKHEAAVEVGLDVFLNFTLRLALLVEELVAGETHDEESLILIFLLEINELGVVGRSESAAAGNVGNEEAVVLALEISEFHRIAFDVNSVDLEEVLRDG